jgi:transposase-like protein
VLVVCDGAKALSAAVREVFGDKALIQRCTLHKRRNVADHLPDKEQAWVDAKLVKAFGNPTLTPGCATPKALRHHRLPKHPAHVGRLTIAHEYVTEIPPPTTKRDKSGVVADASTDLPASERHLARMG